MAVPLAFKDAAGLREWFATHAREDTELWVIFYKAHTGRPTVTYSEAVEEALCVGWIDGKVRRLDDTRYMQRFTPRKPDSYWSTINIRRAKALIDAGRVTEAGRAAFERRSRSDTRRYSFENRPADLPPEAVAQMRKSRKAWEFWNGQPPGYRKVATWYVLSPKRAETRARRLGALIARSAKGQRLPEVLGPKRPKERPRGPRR